VQKITWFTDSPDAGPDCLCSLCGRPIKVMPLRVFDSAMNKEARFHIDCWNKLSPSTNQVIAHEFEDGGTA
jgi:hypothetical protein